MSNWNKALTAVPQPGLRPAMVSDRTDFVDRLPPPGAAKLRAMRDELKGKWAIERAASEKLNDAFPGEAMLLLGSNMAATGGDPSQHRTPALCGQAGRSGPSQRIDPLQKASTSGAAGGAAPPGVRNTSASSMG